MKNRLLTLAGALALLMVLGKFYAKPLLAQVRAALVANVDEPARAPYQVSFDGLCNQSSGPCFLETQPVPTNKRLHVTHISASLTANYNMYVHIGTGGTILDVLAPATSNFGRFVVNQNVDFYLEAGDRLFTSFDTGGGGTLELTHKVTGYLVDCTVAACAATVTQ